MPLGFNYSSGMTVYIYGLYDPRNNNLRYIGKALNLKKRFDLHMREKRNSYKNQWLNQLKCLGLKPEMRVLETIENSNDIDWQERERWWIQCARETGDPITNLDDGGRNGNCKCQETRQLMRIAAIGRKMLAEAIAKMKATKAARLTPEVRERMRLAQLGKKRTPEQREALSLALKGRVQSEETKRKISEKNTGKIRTQAQRDLARETIKRSCHTPEAREKHRKAMAGITPSRNTIEAARLANKGRVFSEETRAKMRAAKLGRKLSAEHLAKLSQSQKERWAQRK